MEIIFLIMLFCMGTVFGSFFTLAVYRIPLGLDITHKRSFCPNCNHRLEFKDLIPVLSYLSLKGKCRYCGKPVRSRYLILEVLSGLVFVVSYFAYKLTFPFFEVESVIALVSFVMFYVTNCLILGIDKEYIKVEKKVLLFGIITNTLYMLYLYTFNNLNLYRYGIYLVVLLILFCLDTFFLKKFKKSFYFLQILMLLTYEISFINEINKLVLGLIISIIITLIYIVLNRIKKNNKIPFGFIISLSSIMCVLSGNLGFKLF